MGTTSVKPHTCSAGWRTVLSPEALYRGPFVSITVTRPFASTRAVTVSPIFNPLTEGLETFMTLPFVSLISE